MKTFILSACFALISAPLLAQLSVGTYYNHHQGLARFGENIGALPQGVSVEVLYRLAERPWSIGVELGKSVYSSRHYGYTFKDSDWGWVSTDVKEAETMTRFNLVGRYHLIDNAALEPYLAGRAGLLSFATARCLGEGTAVESGTTVMDNAEVRQHIPAFERRGTSVRAGVGFGTVINLKRLICETIQDYGFELKLDAGLFYTFGSSAAYRSGTNEVNQPVAQSSAIQDLNLRVGVLLGF